MVTPLREAPLLRLGWCALSVAVGVGFLASAAATLRAPSFAFDRYVGDPVSPQVLARGTLARRPEGSDLPALCRITAEHQQADGEWVATGGIASSRALLEVEWSSSPLPPSVGLPPAFKFEFGPKSWLAEGERRAEWTRRAGAVGFEIADGPTTRVREWCFDTGERVFVKACVSSSDPGMLEPCPGEERYIVRSNEGLENTLAFSDGLRRSSAARRIGWAAFAFLAGLLAFVRPSPLVEAIEGRGGARRRIFTAGATRYGLGAAGVVGFFVSFENGFGWGGGVVLLWLLVALERLLHGVRVRAARAAVLDPRRSSLAAAAGTVALAVRARVRGAGVRSFSKEGDIVAFSELRIHEVYLRVGIWPRLATREVLIRREGDELEIVDDTGEGVLALAHAVLGIEPRRARMRRLPAHLTERRSVAPPPGLYYLVEERVIRDGEQLFVVGDVTAVAYRAAESNYRAMVQVPTIGDEDRPPAVHASGARGLAGLLAASARRATGIAVGAVVAAALLAAALVATTSA